LAQVARVVELNPVAEKATALADWLASGACQAFSGAFVAWVDLLGGRQAFEYPEITGYALTYLAYRPSFSVGERAAALRAADWLDRRLRGGTLAARDGWDGDAVYLFDLGMISAGLISLGRRLDLEQYEESGRRVAGWLRDEVAGGLAPVARRGPATSRPDGWSTIGTPHLAKLTQSLLLADELEAAEAVVRAVSREQEDDGRFRTCPGETATMLHPHLYAAEGLYVWGTAVGDAEALDRAHAAVEWVWTRQLENGGLPRVDSDLGPEQSDVTSQAVRLALALRIRTEAVGRGLRRLAEIACGDERGEGIPYQPGVDLHVNTWATLFGVQALELACQPAPVLAWQELV
jgi:hypothetical protein